MSPPDLLPLPIAPADALAHIIVPAMFFMPDGMDAPAARVLLLAIALQESGLRARAQAGGGPARGLWQFERAGGCAGALKHPATRSLAEFACDVAGIDPSPEGLYWRIEHDDVLACRAARLLLWTDPQPLPALGDEAGAWALYLRTWRPGKPRPKEWAGNYAAALQAVHRSQQS